MKKLVNVVSNDLEPILAPTIEKPIVQKVVKKKNHMVKNK